MTTLRFSLRNVDKLSTMQQLVFVLAFFTVVLIILYINVFCPNTTSMLHIEFNYQYAPTQRNTFIPWNNTDHPVPYHPSLIIIGSVNGGTTLLNNLVLFLESFHDNTAPRDTFYWTRCIPCDQYTDRTHDIYQWNVSETNLCSPIMYSAHKVLFNRNVQQISNRLNQHSQKPPDSPNNNSIQCRIEQYKSRIIEYYPSAVLSRFSAERCSAYIYAPYVAKIVSVLFPQTILLYSIREKASQQYSRAKNFHQGRKDNTGERYFNEQFDAHLDEIESDRVQNGLVPLLKTKQTKQTRDGIVLWYLLYPSIRGNEPSPFQIDFRDLCPYINVLIYMKISSVFNFKYGFSKLKLIQSEWLFADLLRSTRFIHCIVAVKDWNSDEEMKQCDEYYKQNMNSIVSENNLITLLDNQYGKKKEYTYLLGDLRTFDRLSQFWTLCDKRLFELIEEYPSLIVGTRWDYNLWIMQRKKIRNAIIT